MTRGAVLAWLVLAACGDDGDSPTDAAATDAAIDATDAIVVDAATADAVVSEAQCLFGEPNDDVPTATAWALADVEAAICGDGDLDYFRVTLTAGQTLSARIDFSNRAGLGDLDLRLLSGDGGTVYDESRSSSDVEIVSCPGGSPCPALVAGDYLVEIRGFSAAVVSAYALTITIAAP